MEKDTNPKASTGTTQHAAADKAINPFDKTVQTDEDKQATGEEAAAEQLRKDALTERD